MPQQRQSPFSLTRWFFFLVDRNQLTSSIPPSIASSLAGLQDLHLCKSLRQGIICATTHQKLIRFILLNPATFQGRTSSLVPSHRSRPTFPAAGCTITASKTLAMAKLLDALLTHSPIAPEKYVLAPTGKKLAMIAI